MYLIMTGSVCIQILSASPILYIQTAQQNDGNKTNLEKLYKLQERAARTITSSNYEIRSKTMFRAIPISRM